MTTYSAPAPAIISLDTNIQEVMANGTTFGSATAIPYVGGWSVVSVTATDDPRNQAVVLPSGAQIGDVVEIYFSGYTGKIFAPSGEMIGVSASVEQGPGGGKPYRKLTSAVWQPLA